jgi:hypothetical protein
MSIAVAVAATASASSLFDLFDVLPPQATITNAVARIRNALIFILLIFIILFLLILFWDLQSHKYTKFFG